MAFQPTPTDVSVIITSSSVARSADSEPRFLTERRITPTWTVEQVKSKLETMTGVPPGSQRLRVKVPGRPDQWADNDAQLIGDYGIVKGSEIEVGFFLSFFLVCFLLLFGLVSVSMWDILQFLEKRRYIVISVLVTSVTVLLIYMGFVIGTSRLNWLLRARDHRLN
jgi:hypothetical protein